MFRLYAYVKFSKRVSRYAFHQIQWVNITNNIGNVFASDTDSTTGLQHILAATQLHMPWGTEAPLHIIVMRQKGNIQYALVIQTSCFDGASISWFYWTDTLREI